VKSWKEKREDGTEKIFRDPERDRARGRQGREENSNENWCGLVFKIMSCRDITCTPPPSSLGPHSVFFIFSHLIFYFVFPYTFSHFNSFAAIFSFGECFIKFIFADKCACGAWGRAGRFYYGTIYIFFLLKFLNILSPTRSFVSYEFSPIFLFLN